MNTVIILAGGKGTRFGSERPKQYFEVEGKPIISYCIDKFINHPMIDAIQIVADESWHDYILKFIDHKKLRGFSSPGQNRQMSVYNALTDIKQYSSDNDIVIVHDAARPFVSDKLITECIESISGYDGVLPVIRMKDTVYVSYDGKSISEMIDRNKLVSGQAPEAFLFGKYLLANETLLPDRILEVNGSSEVALTADLKIAMISGDENNFKITTRTDLDRFMIMIKG